METLGKNTYERSFVNIYLSVAGLLLVILGSFILFRPFQPYLFISFTFSLLIMLTGLFEIRFAVRNKQSIDSWNFILIGGIVDVCMGSYLLLAPLVIIILLTPLIGIWILYKGFMSMLLAFVLRSCPYRFWRLQLIIGYTIMLIALVVLASPIINFLNVISWTGLGIILVGVAYIFLSSVYWDKGLNIRK